MVADAAGGGDGVLDCSDIRPSGDRVSWAGSASIRGSAVLSSSMAHMVSLGRVVAESGLCVPWPEETFAFSMSSAAVLSAGVGRVPSQAASARPRVASPTAVVGGEWEPIAGGHPLDATEACRTIHEALADLPRYADPGEVPFSNGLYFFFEGAEDSPHGHPRITRIGNHPRKQDRLVGRLQDHYRTRRDAKNGSVFRRYLGGALLRRDGVHSCLAPAPGKGHWEQANARECDRCAPYEQLVTERLHSQFTFACVDIGDQRNRNHLEERLIATVGQCRECQPSDGWLGTSAYSGKVRASGLWNSDYVDGLPANAADIELFQRLARASRPTSSSDLSDTLMLIPCSAGKRGERDLGRQPVAITDFVGSDAVKLLEEGRRMAFDRAHIDQTSDLVPAFARYSGQPYATTGVVDAVLAAMTRGLHVVIVSGGYGLLRPEEPIHNYEAQMKKTLTVWRPRIPAILRDYVARNGIRRTFGAFSRQYAVAVPDRLSEVDWRAVPSFEEIGRTGSAVKVVPERVASLTLDLLERDLQPDDGWTRTG